jgi:mannose-1-phosphate guanylyltransferase
VDFQELKILSFVLTEPLSKADVIVCLEGDGQERTKECLRIFKEKWAPVIIVSGGSDSLPASIIADQMADYLIKNGVKKKDIIIEPNSRNTKEQAEEVMKILKEKGFKKVLLVASHFHQARAFLTFLKAMENFNMEITIVNSPARCLPWFENTTFGKTREQLLESEFVKIKEYCEKGDLVPVEKALKYTKWKEQQV